MIKSSLFFFFTLICFGVFAQPGESQIEEVNGKKFYVYFVQGGNTLWGVHTLFNVPVEEIINSNSGVENGLNEGQKLLIPVVNKSSENTKTHKVEPKETLFGISKKYGVSSDQLITLNPGVENGLKVGQIILIPTDGVSNSIENSTVFKSKTGKEMKLVFYDTIIEHTVLPHESMYSISKRFMASVEDIQQLNNLTSPKIKKGDIIKVPIKKEKVQQIQIRDIEQINQNKIDSTLLYKRKDQYNIAVLLPFYLDKQDGSTKALTDAATEFYMGMKIAFDSLESSGLKAKIYVFDSKNDSTSMSTLLNKKEFLNMDMIVGPIFPDKMAIVAEWCKTNKVKHVCPVSSNASILKGNPFVFATVPTEMTLMEGAAKYVLSLNLKDQLILVKPKNSKDIALYEAFRQAFLNLPSKGLRPKLVEIQLDQVSTFLKKGLSTYFIVPSNDKSFVLKFINTLNANLKNHLGTISVLGTKEWMNFDEINSEYKNLYNYQFPSPNDLNYSYIQTKELLRKYRENYNADMSKVAVQGFDVMFYFCEKYFMNKTPGSGIMSDMELIQKGSGNGFENSTVYILKQSNFEITRIYKTND